MEEVTDLVTDRQFLLCCSFDEGFDLVVGLLGALEEVRLVLLQAPLWFELLLLWFPKEK